MNEGDKALEFDANTAATLIKPITAHSSVTVKVKVKVKVGYLL